MLSFFLSNAIVSRFKKNMEVYLNSINLLHIIYSKNSVFVQYQAFLCVNFSAYQSYIERTCLRCNLGTLQGVPITSGYKQSELWAMPPDL